MTFFKFILDDFRAFQGERKTEGMLINLSAPCGIRTHGPLIKSVFCVLICNDLEEHATFIRPFARFYKSFLSHLLFCPDQYEHRNLHRM